MELQSPEGTGGEAGWGMRPSCGLVGLGASLPGTKAGEKARGGWMGRGCRPGYILGQSEGLGCSSGVGLRGQDCEGGRG